MPDDVRQQIDRELNACMAKYGFGRSSGLSTYLNNFFYHLPSYRPNWMEPDAYPEHATHRFTNKRQNQTYREFWETVDEVIGELGIDPPRFTELDRDEPEFYELEFQVYCRLREMGYNHYPDLVL